MATKSMLIQDEDIQYGPKGSPIVIPEGMTYRKVMGILQRKKEEAETVTAFSHDFIARPWDGAYATAQVVKQMYGISYGKGSMSFFGSNPPQLVSIKTGVDTVEQVPWGIIEIPALEGAEIILGSAQHSDYGMIFQLQFNALKMYKKEVDAFFVEVEKYLKEHSIYKGKAIVGYDEPDFLDLREFRPEDVVYSEDVLDVLDAVLWAPMRFTQRFREDRVSRKRALLLYGPFGTGKTLTGQLTATVAVENGWTFIAARPGRDNLDDIMRTARIYQPAVVFFEDVDNTTNADGHSHSDMAEMLDVFDGIATKGGELICVMTTNHKERIHKAMLRPGRLDAVIGINALDRVGVEKLIRVSVTKGKLADNVDFDAVYEAMDGFYPAFVKETVTRAQSVALALSKGAVDYSIGTKDLVVAAHSMRPQLELMEAASEKSTRPTLDIALSDIVQDVSTKVQNDTILRGRSSGGHQLVVQNGSSKS